jgi:hypothetical protein
MEQGILSKIRFERREKSIAVGFLNVKRQLFQQLAEWFSNSPQHCQYPMKYYFSWYEKPFTDEIMHRLSLFVYNALFPEKVFFCFHNKMMPFSLVKRIFFHWKKNNRYEGLIKGWYPFRQKVTSKFSDPHFPIFFEDKKNEWQFIFVSESRFRQIAFEFEQKLFQFAEQYDTGISNFIICPEVRYNKEIYEFLILIFKLKNTHNQNINAVKNYS